MNKNISKNTSKQIIIREDNIDKDTVRDDILAEVYDKLNTMSVEELLKIRELVFQTGNEVLFIPEKK